MTEPLDARHAERLFGAGGKANDEELLERAAASWREHPDAELAEVARFARVVAYRQGQREVADLWQERAIAAARESGALRSLALSRQLDFFLALSDGAFDRAESVLVEMERLAVDGHDGPPDPQLVARIVAERRGLLRLKQGLYPEAVEAYERAQGLSPEGSRGFFKVAGGRARAEWLGGGSSEAAAAEFARIVEASAEWDDVHRWAIANRDAALRDDRSSSDAFDLE